MTPLEHPSPTSPAPRPAEEPLRLRLPAAPERVADVRRSVGGHAGALGAPPDVVADVRLAVTEACANVVEHAYPDGGGTLEVIVEQDGGVVVVTVRDRGKGTASASGPPGAGLGLPLIEALATTVAVREPDGGGTELRMTFPLTGPSGGAAP